MDISSIMYDIRTLAASLKNVQIIENGFTTNIE